MFYRVENGRLIEAPKKSLRVFIANPTDEQYKFFGYTDKVIEDEKPEISENQYLEEHYEQIDGVIYKHYKVLDIPEMAYPDPEEVIEDESV